MASILKNAFTCIMLFIVLKQIKAKYNIPDLKIQALNPNGLHVALPDEPGVQLLEFHANINKEIKNKEIGDIFNRVSSPFNGNWQFDDKTISLKLGDVIHYWYTVYHDGKTYDKEGLTYTVEGLAPK